MGGLNNAGCCLIYKSLGEFTEMAIGCSITWNYNLIYFKNKLLIYLPVVKIKIPLHHPKPSKIFDRFLGIVSRNGVIMQMRVRSQLCT